MRPLIEHGYVYSAMPPLYKLTRGKTSRVAFSDDERDRISAELRADNPNAKVDISRYKGLGEMDAHELWETTMDPEKRTLKQIRLEDAVKADEIFTLLMGEKVCCESGLLILFPGLSLRPGECDRLPDLSLRSLALPLGELAAQPPERENQPSP